jgi:hypothetical protein
MQKDTRDTQNLLRGLKMYHQRQWAYPVFVPESKSKAKVEFSLLRTLEIADARKTGNGQDSSDHNFFSLGIILSFIEIGICEMY